MKLNSLVEKKLLFFIKKIFENDPFDYAHTLIAVKTMKESDMTPEKKNALRRLEAITRAAEGVEKNKEGYWVNGAYTDLRITNLVYDIILPQKYDKDKTPFTEKGKNKVILNYCFLDSIIITMAMTLSRPCTQANALADAGY